MDASNERAILYRLSAVCDDGTEIVLLTLTTMRTPEEVQRIFDAARDYPIVRVENLSRREPDGRQLTEHRG